MYWIGCPLKIDQASLQWFSIRDNRGAERVPELCMDKLLNNKRGRSSTMSAECQARGQAGLTEMDGIKYKSCHTTGIHTSFPLYYIHTTGLHYSGTRFMEVSPTPKLISFLCEIIITYCNSITYVNHVKWFMIQRVQSTHSQSMWCFTPMQTRKCSEGRCECLELEWFDQLEAPRWLTSSNVQI